MQTMGEMSGYFKIWTWAVSQADVTVFHHIQCGLPQTEEFILYTGDGLTSTQEPHLTHLLQCVPAVSEAWFPLLFSYTWCAYG